MQVSENQVLDLWTDQCNRPEKVSSFSSTRQSNLLQLSMLNIYNSIVKEADFWYYLPTVMGLTTSMGFIEI